MANEKKFLDDAGLQEVWDNTKQFVDKEKVEYTFENKSVTTVLDLPQATKGKGYYVTCEYGCEGSVLFNDVGEGLGKRFTVIAQKSTATSKYELVETLVSSYGSISRQVVAEIQPNSLDTNSTLYLYSSKYFNWKIYETSDITNILLSGVGTNNAPITLTAEQREELNSGGYSIEILWGASVIGGGSSYDGIAIVKLVSDCYCWKVISKDPTSYYELSDRPTIPDGTSINEKISRNYTSIGAINDAVGYENIFETGNITISDLPLITSSGFMFNADDYRCTENSKILFKVNSAKPCASLTLTLYDNSGSLIIEIPYTDISYIYCDVSSVVGPELPKRFSISGRVYESRSSLPTPKFELYVYSGTILGKLNNKADADFAVKRYPGAAIGATNKPVYVAENGEAKEIGYEINKSVPSNAKFTDTTYTAGTNITIENNVISATGGNPLDAYPVGAIYMSVNSTSPASLFGGTWEQIKDTFLIARGDTYTTAGGSATKTIGSANLPKHTHKYTNTTYSVNGTTLNYAQSGLPPHMHVDWLKNCSEYGLNVSQSAGAHFRNYTETYSSAGQGYDYPTGGGYTTFGVLAGTVNATQSHTHGLTATNNSNNSGDGGFSNTALNIMPPYLPVYMWKRTA